MDQPFRKVARERSSTRGAALWTLRAKAETERSTLGVRCASTALECLGRSNQSGTDMPHSPKELPLVRKWRCATLPASEQRMDALNPNGGCSRISFCKRCLFAILPVISLLILAEFTARCFVSETTLAKRFEQIEQIIVFLGNEPGQSIFQPDPNCFWRLKPNVVAPRERGNWWGGVMSNSHGLRSREVTVEEASQKTRVLCFGDSTTFAFGVDFVDAWPNQLQTLQDQEPPARRWGLRPDLSDAENRASRDGVPTYFEVLNAGIPGHTSFQGRQRLAADLEKWRPHLTVITFGNNDGWRWDGLADKDHARGSANPIAAWMNHSRALSWLRACRQQAVQQQATDDVSRWAEQATLNYFDPNERWIPRVSLDDFADNLRAMIAMCREHGSEVVLIVWPDQRQ